VASSFRFNDDGLKRLGRLFGQGGTVVRVGILTGPKKARQKKTGGPNDDATNADIGAEQEFGSFTKKIPPRSFLYKPLSTAKAKKRIVADAAEGLTRELAAGSAVDAAHSFYGKIGAGLVASVQDAFDASGPGWKPLARETIIRRRTRKVWPRSGTKPLIDTGELRNAISFKVLGAE
jgi:hypothetical protein